MLAAIAAGKHVVTANKALLALHGNEIFAAAQGRGVMVAFEGAVAGGIPIIKALREGLTANRIEWIAGIINGTSNFILSSMRDSGASFLSALAEAQRLGYAEADPTFDIEGIDAAHKLSIMSAIAFGIPMQFERAYTEGISQLTADDIRYAEELGYRIKLLGISRRVESSDDGRASGIELRVHPTLIPARRLLANVEGVMNAVLVKGDAVGPTLYYGAGAGAEPTASAVVADLVDVTRLHTADPEHRVPHLAFQPDSLSATPILPIAEVRTAYYLRLRVADKPGVLADITRILADAGISIGAVLQKEPAEGDARDRHHHAHARHDREARRRRDRADRVARDRAVEGDPHPRRGPRLMNLNQVTVGVADVARSIAFYRTLGLELIVQAPHYARFVCPQGRSTFSVHRVDRPAASTTVVYFECDDLDDTVRALTAQGLTFDGPPADQPWLWREARLADPDGNPICLFHAGVNRIDPPWREPDPAHEPTRFT